MTDQKQVTKVFSSLWGEIDTYQTDGIDSYISRHQEWSDGKIGDWISLAIGSSSTNKIKILDAGCGLGITFANIFSTAVVEDKVNIKYTGLDLIDLKPTRSFLKQELSKPIYNISNLEIELVNQDMRSYCDMNIATKDLVIAFGSLHHTDDLKKSLYSTFSSLKPSSDNNSGYYIGWIINSQKPLRASTDIFFRDFFKKFSSVEDCSDELSILSIIFRELSQELGDKTINIPKDSKLLQLKSGDYKLQTLLYDYFLKCYYRSDESERRQLHQLFDWFSPHYYHQTSRDQLDSILLSLNKNGQICEIIDIVSKVNGHYFILRKHI